MAENVNKLEDKGQSVPEEKVNSTVNSIPDNMVLVDVKVLTTSINFIHSVQGEAIDAYNGLVNAVVKSGKIKIQE